MISSQQPFHHHSIRPAISVRPATGQRFPTGQKLVVIKQKSRSMELLQVLFHRRWNLPCAKRERLLGLTAQPAQWQNVFQAPLEEPSLWFHPSVAEEVNSSQNTHMAHYHVNLVVVFRCPQEVMCRNKLCWLT